MGSSSSKFRKHLSNGDEYAALNQYNNSSELRKALDPNSSYGDSHNHETPLHYASKFAMKSLLRIFLSEHNGNPNKTNGMKQTCLHCVCMEKAEHSLVYPVMKKRSECLAMLLKWRGARLEDNETERVNLGAQDEEQNTALHYAALSGLKQCVEMLVQHGAPLFQENCDNQTPCDSAEKGGHADIALYLESKMVFSADGPELDDEDMYIMPDSEEYNGLRAQDLQEAKDQLLVETADMLSVPLFTAEALLRNHEWSREILLEAWMTDPKACCEKSGVIPPPSVYSEQPHVQHSLSSIEPVMTSQHDVECDICTSSFITNEDPVQMACLHQFCKDCWQIYLDLKIQEGEAHNITCPAYDCMKLVSVEVIESVVSRAMARRYLQFDIKAFVESNPNIKWCPFPGCGQAVKMPETYIKLPSDTSKAVDCGKGHLFCWECLGEAHEPASCENWKKWYNKIAEIRPEELRTTEEETENAANCLWLVTNSKSCPNCKSPIQKNEGCNHMKCCKCKYDFCWVCLDPWKRHNSSTGGYFKCNRYEAVKVVNEKVNKAQNEAEDHNTSMQELNKFVHYYTRFKNHENSYKLEEPLLSTTKNKMMKLAEAVTDIATANAETKFVEDAVHQLLKARRVLKCSYVYGYYLDGPGYKKIVFEFMQTELEECTEILSQMVNRLYLRTPRKRIIEQAQIVQRKRQEFLSAIMKGLVPPETPPGLRKQRRRKYSMDFEDDELRSAVLASIQDVDPANPWIKDASGRHTNVTAMLDWPDSDDSDTDVTTIIKLHGTCLRKGCSRTRVKNPRTGDWHEYCSRACMQADQIQASQEQEESQAEVVVDEQMDLLRALEMSRLLYLQEQGILFDQQSRDSVLIGAQTPEESEDKKLKYIVTTQDEQRSTELGDTVQGVPNRTVEDVHHSDCIDCRTVQKLLADTGIGDLDLGPEYMLDLETSDHTNNMPDELLGACAAEVSPDHGHQSSPAHGISNDLTILDFDGASTNNKTFGIIKNLSVSNIDFGEDNKAKTFSTKPKITNTIANNTGELLPKTSNICWSNLSRQRKQSNHDRQYMELELADQASGGHAEDLSIKPTQENQNDFDLQLSLKQFMNELTLHGCKEFENKPSEDQEYKTRETTNLDLPMLNVKGDNFDLSLDLDMSVKSGYDPSIQLSSDEPGPNHTTDLELTTDPVLTADLKITSDLEFDDDMHEAETVVTNFLNAQMLKNFTLEAEVEDFQENNNLPSPGASVDPSFLNQTDDASRRDSTVESVNETGDDSNIQNISGMEENDCDDKSTFV
ncbi:ankyrin repeat and IBR domain-containing protein 1-like [Mytilus edulis]|uniref:ankyrin repeat and IBR domain-containing protein 1-like n=1 Tax=Mytilus edulis TaxID=6550 RepID=UPI0039F0CC5E